MSQVHRTPMQGRGQPSREEVAGHPRLRVIENNLATAMLGRLRDGRTDVFEFNVIAAELAGLVLYEACRDIAITTTTGEGFDGRPIDLQTPAESIAGVVILRAGLIFEPAFRLLFPTDPLYQLGLSRDEETLEPTIYADNLPSDPSWAERVLIFDPMLATGGTATAAIDVIRRHHNGPIDIFAIVAAPYGVQAVTNHHPNTHITTLALDDALNDQGYIVPGLGDAGDRFFGTV